MCLLAALLVVHWGTPNLDQTTYRDIGSILNGAGTVGTDENVRPSSAQPPAQVRSIATEARQHGQQRELATSHAAPWALTPASPATPASLPAAVATWRAEGAPVAIAATAFQQRAPPSTT